MSFDEYFNKFHNASIGEKIQAKMVWNAAIQEVAFFAKNGCLVPPDGGSPTERDIALCDGIFEGIMQMKSA